MSLHDLIRETERMRRFIDSVSMSTQIAQSVKLASALSADHLAMINRINEQYASIGRASQVTIPTELLMPNVDYARITAALQPSLDMARLFRQFSAPLTLMQADYLRTLRQLTPSFKTVIEQLSGEARLLGEFEATSQDDSELSSEADSETSEIVIERFQLVRFLPITVIDAIAANPELVRGLDPRDFEKLIADLLATLEFENIILTPCSHDGGRDVIATKFISGIPLLFSFECKRYDAKIGVEIMRGLLGSVAHGHTKANKGVLVTTSTFTRDARDFIVSEPLVDGKDFNDLVVWLNVYKTKAT